MSKLLSEKEARAYTFKRLRDRGYKCVNAQIPLWTHVNGLSALAVIEVTPPITREEIQRRYAATKILYGSSHRTQFRLHYGRMLRRDLDRQINYVLRRYERRTFTGCSGAFYSKGSVDTWIR